MFWKKINFAGWGSEGFFLLCQKIWPQVVGKLSNFVCCSEQIPTYILGWGKVRLCIKLKTLIFLYWSEGELRLINAHNFIKVNPRKRIDFQSLSGTGSQIGKWVPCRFQTATILVWCCSLYFQKLKIYNLPHLN